MKKTLLCFLSIFTLSLSGPSLINSSNLPLLPDSAISYINSVQNLWVSSNKWIKDLTKSKAKLLATLSISLTPVHPVMELKEENLTFPWFFDSRIAWPGCTTPILAQGDCGSCWAFGAIEAFSDRICISSAGKYNPVLSPQFLINCDSGNYGCNGGYLGEAWNFMKKGVPTTECVEYTGNDENCQEKCDDGEDMKKFYVKNPLAYKGVPSIQQALITAGPVETGFLVYEDFMSYSEGIYAYTFGELVGGHAVKIIGWGIGKGVRYWICANSWGKEWGVQGYFNIKFGECGIDYVAYAGLPLVH